MPFQPLDGEYQGGRNSTPQLCVWSNAKWHLTNAADRQYFADTDHVGIHHDPQREGVVVGLEPDPEDTQASHVRKLTRSDVHGADINALSMLDDLGIDPEAIEESHAFDLEECDDGPIAVTVDLAPIATDAPKPDEPPAEPGPVEHAAAQAVEADAEAGSPDEPAGDNAEEIFEAGVEDDPEFADLDTPEWLDEGSFYASLDRADDLDSLREVLGWRDHDGDLETLVDRLDVWPELHGGSNA